MSKRAALALIVTVAVVLVGAGVGVSKLLRHADPCRDLGSGALLQRYPTLRELAEQQKAETEALLRQHRRQDVRINLQLGGEEMTVEEAMQLSLQQIEELSALRERHQAELVERCQELVRASK